MEPGIVGGNALCARFSTVSGGGGVLAALFAFVLLAAPSLALSGVVWPQQAELQASDGAQYDNFGFSVGVSGDLAVVGSPYDDNVGGTDAGSVYVYLRDPVLGTWTLNAKLVASDGAAFDDFGYSVAISGNTILVGAPFDDNAGGANAGSAYVFIKNPVTGIWTLTTKLLASDGASSDEFGTSVAIDGDNAVIGAPLHSKDPLLANVEGAAYVFVRDPPTESWSQQAELFASDGGVEDAFGTSVAISGGTVVVGAPFNDRTFFFDVGAAYVFVWCPETGTWEQQTKLSASDGAEFDDFGTSVGISGDTAIVGAPFHSKDPLLQNSEGAAYVFVRDVWLGVWTEQAKLTASDAAPVAYFGTSVAISCDTVVVGARGDGIYAGSAYVFVRDTSTGTWPEQAKLDASDRAVYDQFGTSVSIDYDTALVGAPYHDKDVLTSNSGSAYVFV